MIKLNYMTKNPRWGFTGIEFDSLESYSLALGYLSNPEHYRNLHPSSLYANISLHVESNNEQGAWAKEGRIHCYRDPSDLRANFEDLAKHCSQGNGNGNIKCRINSNGYIRSLIDDYGFEVKSYEGYSTVDVFPTDKVAIINKLKEQLKNIKLMDSRVDGCLEEFERGYNLQF